MRLYVNPISPFCRAAGVCLAECGVAFETVELTTGADRARLLEVGSRGEVPVLETADLVIEGSQAICDFVEIEAGGSPLVPPNPAARIACRRLEDVACSTADALQFMTHLVHIRRPELGEGDPPLRERLAAAVGDLYAFLDATLGEQPFLVGSYSRADVFTFAMVSSLQAMGQRVPPERAALAAWVLRVSERPAIVRDFQSAAQSAAAQARSADPYFRDDRIHWRSHRVEWACRLGLAAWLATEIQEGRAYFSPGPGQ